MNSLKKFNMDIYYLEKKVGGHSLIHYERLNGIVRLIHDDYKKISHYSSYEKICFDSNPQHFEKNETGIWFWKGVNYLLTIEAWNYFNEYEGKITSIRTEYEEYIIEAKKSNKDPEKIKQNTANIICKNFKSITDYVICRDIIYEKFINKFHVFKSLSSLAYYYNKELDNYIKKNHEDKYLNGLVRFLSTTDSIDSYEICWLLEIMVLSEYFKDGYRVNFLDKLKENTEKEDNTVSSKTIINID